MEEKKLWYVVNAYSGHEQKVKDYLESRRESMGMENNIFRVIIPERTEIEIKDETISWTDLTEITYISDIECDEYGRVKSITRYKVNFS